MTFPLAPDYVFFLFFVFLKYTGIDLKFSCERGLAIKSEKLFINVVYSMTIFNYFTLYFRQFSQEKKELQHQIKKHKEKNETLCRLNSELNQELQEVMEQRIALEIQMEHLRPYGGSYLYS